MRIDQLRGRAAFTIVEIMVVVAIIGVLAAFAVPSWRRYQRNQQLRAVASGISNAFSFARSRAIATGNRYVVVFPVGVTTDVCGNDLYNENGRYPPALVFDDGAPDVANCCYDAGEERYWVRDVPNPPLFFGVWNATAAAPTDSGGGIYLAGTTFTEPGAANDAQWVVFQPDGIPVAFNAACNLGTTGSGAGAVYITNRDRDYAIVLNPLGTSSVERWDAAQGAWEN